MRNLPRIPYPEKQTMFIISDVYERISVWKEMNDVYIIKISESRCLSSWKTDMEKYGFLKKKDR